MIESKLKVKNANSGQLLALLTMEYVHNLATDIYSTYNTITIIYAIFHLQYFFFSTIYIALSILSNFFFFSVKNACQSTPCLNNGKCQHGFTDKTFRCLCLAGFDGEVCERGN